MTRCLRVVAHREMAEVHNCVELLFSLLLTKDPGGHRWRQWAVVPPVVASSAASLPEVIGGAGLLYAPDDHEGMAEALRVVLTNENLRQSLIARGLARVRQFTWEETARRTVAVYEEVISRMI